jgi:hypothetical protein
LDQATQGDGVFGKTFENYQPIKDINDFFTTFVSLYKFMVFMYKCLIELQTWLKTKKNPSLKTKKNPTSPYICSP